MNNKKDQIEIYEIIDSTTLIEKNKEENLEKEIIVSNPLLIEEIKKVEIKLEELPDIEVREVVIKETGNFLNLKDNIINIPVEMLIFPFFTPQKQKKRVNIQYTFEDMGVNMMCTLIAKNSADKVFQPSIFEEKIYTYLISLYESKMDVEEGDEYIDFEISDFIVNFLGNKMNRTYYTKVEQALKNLKSTEYQFVVSNHTKLGKYKFEDEEFKLLTYQKLKVGKKIYYRVTLNKNIRKKIKEKRYVKYNSKTLVEIMNLDPIAARIYKYISKIRYEQTIDTINIRTLAAIIPLKTDQITERVGKNGKTKQYILCRLKQVLSRIQKAFDVILELGYIEVYSIEEIKEQNTYNITYKFNKEKDGTCHISTYIDSKTNKEKTQIAAKNKVKLLAKNKIEVNEVLEKKEIVKKESLASKTIGYNYPVEVLEKIKKVKRNLYVNKSWDKRSENKIYKIFIQEGEEFIIKILNEIYKNLTSPIKTTLVQYINGVVKNILTDSEVPKKRNLTLFNGFTEDEKKENLQKFTKTGIKRVGKTFNKAVTTLEKKDIETTQKLFDTTLNDNVDAHEKELKKAMEKFEKSDEYRKAQIEKKAIKLCSKEMEITEKIILTMRDKLKPAYKNTIKEFIKKVMDEEGK